MPLFAYQARDKSGERISGTREAPDKRAALEALREKGFFVTQLAPAADGRSRKETRTPEIPASVPNAEPSAAAGGPAAGAAPPAPRPVTPGTYATTAPPVPQNLWLTANAKDLSLFYRQMHSMLNAGTSVGAALNTLVEHGPNPSIRHAAGEMARVTTQGTPLNEAMRAYPSLFEPLALGMIAAGENGGFLDRMCQRLSTYCERDYEIQQTIKRETWYPKLLVFCAILIPSAIPLVVTWNAGGNALAAWLRNIVPPFAIIGLFWLAWKGGKRAAPIAMLLKPLQYAIDWLKLKIPGVQKTSRAFAAAKFCRTMGALYSAGMGAGRMIDISAGACGNAALAESARRTIPQVERGAGLTEALESTHQFPPIAIQMLRTGEMTGNVDTQLDKVADFLEQDAETAIRQVVKLFSILLYLAVAAYVGSILLRMLMTGYINPINDLINEGGG